jgi:nucleoside-diphosphate-sugar epimerase
MILVTGHRGFLGSLLFKRLDAVGIDVRDGNNLLTCKLPRADVVYHLAAQSDVVNSWNDPLHDLENVRITARLVHEYPDAKIIYANSCASLARKSPYGFSKWASAEYLKCFHKNYVNCIFPNIYGEGSRSVVDIFRKSNDVTIYGDGLQTRDYVHADDIVAGLIKAQYWATGDYFMGSGVSTSLLQLAEGKFVTFAPARDEDKEVMVPNSTPNWTPTISLDSYI